MEVSLRNNQYPCQERVFSQSVLLSEGQECVVPDTRSDIASVICTSANPLIRSKDVSDGRVRLEANVPARITCCGEDGSIFCLDVNIPFYLSAQDEQITAGSCCVALMTLRQTEVRLLNPRKLSVRAELEITIDCYAESAVTTYLAPEDSAEELHVLERSAQCDCVACVTEKTFILTDEAALSEQMPAAAEIVGQSASVAVREVKAVGSKLIASGSVESELIYRCEAGALHAFSFQTSFSQIVETGCEAEDATAQLTVLLSGMYYEIIPGSDMREFAMELHLVAQAIVPKAQELRYLADVYSNQYRLEVQTETRCLTGFAKEAVAAESGRPLLETPEEVSAVVCCRAEPIGSETEGGEAFVRLRLRMLYRSGEGYRSAERVILQRLTIPAEAAYTVRICDVSVPEVSALPASGGAEVRYTVEAHVMYSETREVECISAISYDENLLADTDELPTLVLMRVNSRQSLWELAKENCSTVEAICDANGLDAAAGDWDRLLIIPKTL